MNRTVVPTTAAHPQARSLARTLFAWGKPQGTLAGLAGMLPALALGQMPTGGTVVAGAATIATPDANTAVINQASNKAVLNWNSFSIGQDGFVQFVQPSASAIALNRVVGSDPSAIMGRLAANGQVFLVNPNGILFGAGARVDVAGIVATTLDIRDEDFLAGDYRFTRVEGAADGAVVNAGTLAANGGYVVLAGDYVANRGVVEAQAGTALLASGSAVTLQLAGNTLVNYAIDEATVAHLAGVDNAGQILANGGRVIMTAEVANDLAATVVNNSGLVQAHSTVAKDGAIHLLGAGGDVANSGTLDAAAETGADGGHVELRASGDIHHEAGSRITVSGADTGVSDAGSVYSWADGTNRYKAGAAIAARGGAEGGDGGAVEISGHKVEFDSVVDLRAARGALGTVYLDPNYIYISSDGTAVGADGTPDSVIQESVLEAQLREGNVAHTATGANAAIVLGDLVDGTLDGTDAGSGGSLALTASGSNAGIRFLDTSDTIRVDGALTLTANDGADGHAGTTIAVGKLQAGSAIALEAGSIATGELAIEKAIATGSDTSYGITARAHEGNLTVAGDVTVDVTNATAAGVATNVSLTADAGNVSVSGAVRSSATGKGYYHYNWATSGEDATSYYGAQPWTLQNQGDHRITAGLAIQAGGDVTLGATMDVLATDTNSAFTGNATGGYWQTATAIQHNFWRPTAAQATAAVNADGDVAIGGTATVKADGYATADYAEVEGWREMVNQYHLVTQNQDIYYNTGYPDYSSYYAYTYTTTTAQGGWTGNYTWSQSGTNVNGSTANYSPNTSAWSTGSSGTVAGPMAYSGAGGLVATLDVDAGGDAALNGLDVRATNRSGTGSGSYTDANWGRQDTSGAGLSVSGAREKDWYDNFSTSHTASTATAAVNITAGDDRSVSLDAASNVVASHTELSAAGNTRAGATMTVTAGSAGGASGHGTITLGGPVNVDGADDADIRLTVHNHDGDVVQAADAAAVTVINRNASYDARAAFISDGGAIALDDVAVTAGRAAYLAADAAQTLHLTGTAAASAASRAQIDLLSGGALLIDAAPGAVTATATGASGVAEVNLAGAAGVTAHGALAATAGSTLGTAAIDVLSAGGDILLTSGVAATAYGTTSINVDADAGSTTLAASGTVTATSSAGGYTADVDLTGGSGLTVDGDVTASANAANGAATVDLTTTGGPSAAIAQGSGSTVLASATTASVRVNAGAASPNSVNAAAFDLNGNLQAAGTTGTATIAVAGQSGSVKDFSATSTANAASATIGTTGNGSPASGHLTLDGTGVVTANHNSTTGTTLTASATDGNLDASAATLAVTNNSAGSSARAVAALTANGGSATLGSIVATTAGSGSSTAMAYIDAAGTAGLRVAGPLSATTDGSAARAQIDLDSTAGTFTVDANPAAVTATANGTSGVADVNIAGAAGVTANGAITATAANSGGTAAIELLSAGGDIALNSSLAATANANASVNVAAALGATTLSGAGSIGASATAAGYNADVDLTGGSGITVDGTVSATASAVSGSATVDLATTGGSGAAISQGSGSTVLASATTGAVRVNAGSAEPHSGNAAAFDLAGSLQAAGTGGTGTIAVTGRSGSVASFSASSVANAASAGFAALAGDLQLGGTGAVTAAADAAATASATGVLTLGDATHGIAVTTTGSGSTASLNASGDTALAIDGALLASAGSGSGAALLVLSSGGDVALGADVMANAGGLAALTVTGAGLAQAADTTLQAAGGTAVTVLAAGGELALSGATRADATSGTADLVVSGAAGSVHELAATSAGNAASASLTTTGGTLDLGHAATVVGNTDSASGALLTLAGATALDTGAATLVVSNSSAGMYAGAQAVLTAAAGDATVGSATVTTAGGGTALLTGQASGELATVGALAASAADSSGLVVLDADSLTLADDVTVTGMSATLVATAAGSLTQAAGTTVRTGATDGMATLALTSAGAMAIAGELTAAATADGTAAGEHTGFASLALTTTGGPTATLSQGGASTIAAVGLAADLSVRAGHADLPTNTAQAAAFDLAGTLAAHDAMGGASLTIAGAAGRVHDFNVSAGHAPARATITTYDAAGTLVLDGTGTVAGNADSDSGARLAVTAAGALDAAGATLTVANDSSGTTAGAQATLAAGNGSVTLGRTSVTGAGQGAASLDAVASANLTAAAALDAGAADGTAAITLVANGGGVTLAHDVSASGGRGATLVATAAGNLAQTGATASAAAGTGDAAVVFSSGGAMTLAGGTTAASTDGDAALVATSTGAMSATKALRATAGDGATIGLTTTGGSGAALTLGAGSLVRAAGASAHIDLAAGAASPTAANAAQLALGGTLQAAASTGTAVLAASGRSANVGNFSVTSSGGTAETDVTTLAGALTLTGTGTVSGAANAAEGASLVLDAATSLDTRAAVLSVRNSSKGADAGAQAVLVARGGDARPGPVTVATDGGGSALLDVSATGSITVGSDLLARALNTGAGGGSAHITLVTATGDIAQSAGTRIRAEALGTAAGDASVDVRAGACCTSNVTLDGEVQASVSGGHGDASVGARAMQVSVNAIAANVTGGTGDALIELAAPRELRVLGVLDSQAVADASAGITLVSDKLAYTGGKAILSRGNGRVQLAPFSTEFVIGVHSEPDFDATPHVNYTTATMQKFTGYGAELRFGGEFDRSGWYLGETACVVGMDKWADTIQHTAHIHVAGAEPLTLADTRMVFDTEGITYYHDSFMSPWSVPDGRTAIYVPRPTVNIDRYVDRTDNGLQPAGQSADTIAASPAQTATPPQPGTTQLAGNMFLDGEGVNLDGGTGAGEGTPGMETGKGTPAEGEGSLPSGGADDGGAADGTPAGSPEEADTGASEEEDADARARHSRPARRD